MLRTFVNGIFSFIGSESLTDEEFETLEAVEPALTESYTKALYDALKETIQNRDGVSGQGRKLKAYFSARGVDVSGSTVPTPNSNILIGKPL